MGVTALVACGSRPSSPTQPTPNDYLVIVRPVSAQTGASIAGVQVTVVNGSRAGYAVSTPSDQAALQLPGGPVTLRVLATGQQPVDYELTITAPCVMTVKWEP